MTATTHEEGNVETNVLAVVDIGDNEDCYLLSYE